MKGPATIVMATHNDGKIREFRSVLEPLGYRVLSVRELMPLLAEPEETGLTFMENASLKAAYYMKHTGLPCLADDSGLIVDALDGRPGVFSARYAGEDCDDEKNNRKLIRELAHVPYEKRTASYACVLVLIRPDGSKETAEGRCDGIVRDVYAGAGGFGYDPLFYLPQLGKTMAELSLAEKNQISHRGRALRQLADRLSHE